jgi:hypothetical protein
MGPSVRRDDEGIFGRLRSSTLNFLIPYPRSQNLTYLDRVLSREGRFLEAFLKWTERKLAGPGRSGPADRLVAKVERREALRPTSLGAHGWRYQLCEAKRLLRLRGVPLAHPGASRRSTSLARFARDCQTSDALRRENESVRLFEI